MKEFKLSIHIALTVVIFVGMLGPGWAEPAVFECGGCHDNTRDILPKNHKKSDFSTCFTCHGKTPSAKGIGAKVHRIHLSKGDVTSDTCQKCHPIDQENKVVLSVMKPLKIKREDLSLLIPKMKNWLQSDQLAYTHNQQEISCLACHGTLDEQDLDTYSEKCIGCHGGFNVLSDKKSRFQNNPHKSHCPDLACTSCHQSHGPFTDLCAQCHDYGFNWKIKSK